MKTTLETSGEDWITTLETSEEDVTNTLEKSGEDWKTTLETSVVFSSLFIFIPCPKMAALVSNVALVSVFVILVFFGNFVYGNMWVKNTLETSGKDVKTTLETGGEDMKTTLKTSGELW